MTPATLDYSASPPLVHKRLIAVAIIMPSVAMLVFVFAPSITDSDRNYIWYGLAAFVLAGCVLLCFSGLSGSKLACALLLYVIGQCAWLFLFTIFMAVLISGTTP